MQHVRTMWQQLMTRVTTRPAADPSGDLTILSQQHQDLLKERWWYWRHYFLEAKRRTLDAQRDQ